MNRDKIFFLGFSILLIVILLVCFYFFNIDTVLDSSTTLASVFMVLFFFNGTTKGQLFLGVFLFSFMISEVIYFFAAYNRTLVYYLGNGACLIAYLSLFNHVIIDMSLRKLLEKFIFHIVILLGLTIYLFVVLDNMIKLTKRNFAFLDYLLESSYNFFVILVLVFSILHYLYHLTNKALFLFAACLFLSFSEFTQVSYLFVNTTQLTNVVYTAFVFISFYFFYRFMRIKPNEIKAN